MNKVILISLFLIFFTTASAGISTQNQDILKLIGTTFANNGKFAWIELNGDDYGWIREGGMVGHYRIVIIEMGEVLVQSKRKTFVLEMIEETESEFKQ